MSNVPAQFHLSVATHRVATRGIMNLNMVCILGTELRQFYRGPLYICGRDPVRTRRIAGVLRAKPLPGWEAAVEHRL